MRTSIPWNRDWLYAAGERPGTERPSASERGFERVCLPHANACLPANYFSDRDTQFVCWYRKRFALPSHLSGQRVFVDFGSAMMAARVFINGHRVVEHRGGYVPFSAELTPHVRFGLRKENVLAVRVDARLDPGIPPCGHVMDYLTFGGLYREATLRAVPPTHLASVFARAADVLKPLKRLAIDVELADGKRPEPDALVEVALLDPRGRPIAAGASPVADSGAGPRAATVSLEGLRGIRLWDLERPALYGLRTRLSVRGRVTDETLARIGFREAVFTKEGPFRLNGKAIKLIGLNRHQTYPYIGAAAPARLQRRDADILKRELGCHIVRTSHYPQSPHFLDRCDEIGLLVFEEIPGWGHIGDARWQDLACRDVEAMIRRDRNHPSIVLWGVRINESGDSHDFYARTNELARELDPTRQTGGARFLTNSEMLEDVYTFNDFHHGMRQSTKILGEPGVTPYLITEYIGANLDARHTDSGKHLARHAMAHAEVQNAVHGHPKIAGGIGWCAFDYASQDWITVDGIQPWGVSDIFRCPKFAAYFYESQISPRVRPVLRVASRWRVGDQANFDPNSRVMSGGHDAGLVVFTNCRAVDVYVGGEKRGTFAPARALFPYLPHPPVICTGLGTIWGPSWRELRVAGRRGGRVVAEQRFPATNGRTRLELSVDDSQLAADGSDMTRVLCRHVDVFGNSQPHSRLAVAFSVSGPATLVGDNPLSLVGGSAAVYLRAGERPGRASVTATATGMPAQTARVRIVGEDEEHTPTGSGGRDT